MEVFATATHAIQWLQSQLYSHPGRCLCTQMWGDSQDYQWCWPPARFSTTLQPPIEELFAEVKRYLKAYNAVVKATTTPEAIVHTAFVVYYYYCSVPQIRPSFCHLSLSTNRSGGLYARCDIFSHDYARPPRSRNV